MWAFGLWFVLQTEKSTGIEFDLQGVGILVIFEIFLGIYIGQIFSNMLCDAITTLLKAFLIRCTI